MKRSLWTLFIACALVNPHAIASAGEVCVPSWLPTFGGDASITGSIYSLVVFDDGSGPALYAGGSFTVAGGVTVNRIAKWTGKTWLPLGKGMNGAVWSLAVFDNGSGNGPALYAGGDFTTANGQSASHIATWNGMTWSALGSGMSGGNPIVGRVSTMKVFDDGSGPALYVGGYFTHADGVLVNRIAKWKDNKWSALGSGMDRYVNSLAVFDKVPGEGGAQALYASGDFAMAGGTAAIRVASWDGNGWTNVGGMNGPVYVLHVFDDGLGAGPLLYAGGTFTSISGVPFSRIAKLTGASWQPLGTGLAGETVRSMAVFDDGTSAGPMLYVGGGFTSAGGTPTNFIATWNGQSWSTVGGGFRPASLQWIYALAELAEPEGAAALYAGGNFTGSPAGDVYIAKWLGCDGQTNCEAADINCDLVVNVADLLLVISSWGPCPSQNCPADVNSDHVVNVADLLLVISNWG